MRFLSVNFDVFLGSKEGEEVVGLDRKRGPEDFGGRYLTYNQPMWLFICSNYLGEVLYNVFLFLATQAHCPWSHPHEET